MRVIGKTVDDPITGFRTTVDASGPVTTVNCPK